MDLFSNGFGFIKKFWNKRLKNLLDLEKRTWEDHILIFDATLREESLAKLDELLPGTNIYIKNEKRCYLGQTFDHWYVTDFKHYVSFGWLDDDIYDAKVSIQNFTPNESFEKIDMTDILIGTDVPQSCKLDENMRGRIKEVLGVNNYSLALRNSEHVANYIFRGSWASSQVIHGHLKDFISEMSTHKLKLLNTLPRSRIKPHIENPINSEIIYQFLQRYYKATKIDNVLHELEDSFNVLLIGPTGSGKSHLINVIFNQNICESVASHRSATKEVYFIYGEGMICDKDGQEMRKRNVIVADTVGLCDTEWNDEEIFELTKNKIYNSFNKLHAVFIVFRTDRLTQEVVGSIKAILRWLNYSSNYDKIQLAATCAENLNDEKIAILQQEAMNIFHIPKKVHQNDNSEKPFHPVIFTAFPPEESLNDCTRTKVEKSYANLGYLLTNSSNPISRDSHACRIS